MKKVLLIAAALAVAAQGATVSADSTRGAKVFETQGCVSCHSLNGIGPKVGPDLGRIADRGFTPAALAATMWNHAPAMWAEMKKRGVARPAMDEQQSADLFAFFYSLRFFEEPGDAARGKALFTSRRCSTCHGLTEAKPIAGAKPVSQWTAAADPLELVETMWNHSSLMRTQMAKNNIRLPLLKGQELADLLVYTRRATNRPAAPAVFRAASAEEGNALFESKKCSACHGTFTGFLSGGLRDRSLTDIAADMWNHGLDMSLEDAKLAPGEMRQIADFVWFSRSIEGVGEAGRGAQVFTAKKCTVCHDDPASGAPSLAAAGAANGQKYFSGVSMVSALTRHGPTMLDKMQQKHLAWPRFSAEDMSGLIAYLNTRTGRNGR